MATPSPLLRNPALQQTHSCPTQAVLRVLVAASMPQPPSSMRAAALVTVKGAFTPNHVFPRACVAATGRAISIGLSVLIGMEREAAIELAGGKLTTGVAVHASVHSNRARLTTPLRLPTTTPLRLPSQRSRRGQGFVRTRCANLRLSWRRHPCLDHTRVLACRHVDIVQPRTAGAFAVQL